MRRVITLCVALCFMHAGGLRASGGGTPGGGDAGFTALPTGGDVLRPGRNVSRWALGLDAGITYSMFSNGPVNYYSPNPFNSVFGYLESTITEGNGIGLYFGGTADYSVSKHFGIVLKANYHQCMGSFDDQTDLQTINPDTQTGLTTILGDKVDWTFDYFGIDLLARIQIVPKSWYVLVGPSFGALLSNRAKLTQSIVRPDDIYYFEQPPNLTPNMVRQAHTDVEVQGFESSRFDGKLGIGTWVPLSRSMFLTPEVTLSIPLTHMVKSTPATTVGPFTGTASIEERYFDLLLRPDVFVPSNTKWNALSFTLTVGLRWML